MARLIDADTLLKDLQRQFDEYFTASTKKVHLGDKVFTRSFDIITRTQKALCDSIVEYIKARPTVDSVEVVRCMDCVKFCPDEIRKLYNTEKYCMRTGWMCNDDDFCSFGERRNNEID